MIWGSSEGVLGFNCPTAPLWFGRQIQSTVPAPRDPGPHEKAVIRDRRGAVVLGGFVREVCLDAYSDREFNCFLQLLSAGPVSVMGSLMTPSQCSADDDRGIMFGQPQEGVSLLHLNAAWS